MDFKSTVQIFLLIIFILSNSRAQDIPGVNRDTVYQFPDIVISANRYETSLLSTASSVTVLTAEDLSQTKKSTLLEVLRGETGISLVQSGGPGKLATVNIRGANPTHTLVIIDGVEMNMPSDPGSVYDFANLPLSNIERVEILRGPQSTLYGSDAMAGVINVITKKQAAGSNYFINAETGSYNTYSGSAGLSGKYDHLNYSLSLSGMSTEGFSSASENYGNTEKDGADNRIANAGLGFSFSDNVNLQIISKFTAASADYDQIGGDFGDDPTYKFNLEETIIRPELKITSSFWDQTIGVSYYRTLRNYSFDSTSAYFAFSSSVYDGKKYKIDWLNKLKLSRSLILSLGADAEKESAVSNYLEYNTAYTFNSSFPESEMNTVGVFLEGNSEILPDAHLSAGLRYDRHNIFGSIFTYRLASVYFIRYTGTKIKATFGTGFKTPSLFNLYDPTFGNKELDPEESKGWDAGIEQYFLNENILLGLTYFHTSFKNLFGSDNTFRTININKAETEGIEAYYAYNATEYLRMKFNYTFAKSTDKNPALQESERQLLRRPEHKVGINFTYKPVDRITLNLDYIYTGERKDKRFGDFIEPVDLKPYSLLNFAGSYDLLENLELYTRLENIFNQEYEEVYGYGVPGFSIYGGVKLNF